MIETDDILAVLTSIVTELTEQTKDMDIRDLMPPKIKEAMPDEIADALDRVASGGSNIAASYISFQMVTFAIRLSRDGAVLHKGDFLDVLKGIIHEKYPHHSEVAESLKYAKVLHAIDDKGESIHSSIEVAGLSYAPPDLSDSSDFGHACREAVEAHENVWDPTLYAEAHKLIDSAQAEISSKMEDAFNGTVTRVAERTEQEIASFRDEIDSMFPTWEGGT